MLLYIQRKGNKPKGKEDKKMKDYEVNYMLGDFYHGYIVTATSEAEAMLKVLKSLPDESRKRLHDFKIKRYYEIWN